LRSQKTTKNQSNIPVGNIYNKYSTKNPLYKFLINNFLKQLDNICLSLKDCHTVLEVGTGEGYLLNRISRLNKFAHLEGVDISEGIIKQAKENYPHLKLRTGSIYKLDFEPRKFDLVILWNPCGAF